MNRPKRDVVIVTKQTRVLLSLDSDQVEHILAAYARRAMGLDDDVLMNVSTDASPYYMFEASLGDTQEEKKIDAEK